MSEPFPQSWFLTGVVSAESAADFARYAAKSPQRSARHWKWLAFRDWAEERAPLTAEQCRAAYVLGEADADMNLGTAMMCHALLQRACPAEVREVAKRSDRAPVRRAAGVQ